MNGSSDAKLIFKFAAMAVLFIAILTLILLVSLASIEPVAGEDNVEWITRNSGTTVQLHGVHALDATHVWAVGEQPILFFDGTSWSSHTPGDYYHYDAFALDPSHVWTVGLGQNILFYDGSAWSTQDAGTACNIYGVSALDSTQIWAVGGIWDEWGGLYSIVFFSDGSSWTTQESSSVDAELYGVSAFNSSNVWAVGGDHILFYNGSSWGVQASDVGAELWDVSALNDTHVWAVGSQGTILFYDGSSWTPQTSGTSKTLWGVSALDANNVWAVGEGGTILFYDGSSWTLQTSGTSKTLYGVSALDATHTWAVGEGGTILFRGKVNYVSASVSGGHGTVSPATQKLCPGESASIEITPDAGYHIASITDNGVEMPIANPYVIDNVTEAHDVVVSFTKDYDYYFAEGCTRDGFDEWLCIQNPGLEDVTVNATYMLFGGPPKDAEYTIPASSRVSINVNAEVGPGQDVSVRLWGEEEFYPERPMYFNYKAGAEGYSWDGGHVSTGAFAPACDWYFAEGCTREGFEEWLCIQNPNDKEVDVQVDYITASAYTQSRHYPASANSRISVFVNGDVGPEQDVSVHVHCDDPVVAERPMYFNYQGKWTGGHVVMGTDSSKTIWYFAEGTTREGFDEWLAVQNPNNSDAKLTVRFLKDDGGELLERYTVGANSRWTLNASTPLGTGVDSAMVVESSVPVVAERPMYFDYNGVWTGGHDVLGTPEPKAIWYFPEGCTRDGFDEYICVANPGEEQARVTFTFMLGAGEPIQHVIDISPHQRFTLSVPGIIGRNQDVSTEVSSDQPVVAERPMYFNYNGAWTGGHDVVGYAP